MGWLRACLAEDVADGDAIVVDRSPEPPIAVFNVGGAFYAIDDTCSHEDYSLADGYVDGPVVECALHMAKFDVRTGKVLCLPATRDVAPYAVKVQEGVVFVEV